MISLSAALLRCTLILSVSAETRKFTLNIEMKNISPDGQRHQYQAAPLSDQFPRLQTKCAGNQPTDPGTRTPPRSWRCSRGKQAERLKFHECSPSGIDHSRKLLWLSLDDLCTLCVYSPQADAHRSCSGTVFTNMTVHGVMVSLVSHRGSLNTVRCSCTNST